MITVNIVLSEHHLILFTNFVAWNTKLKLYSIPFNPSSNQVSKTDPSPKREMPTMILFNVVFALRVKKVIFFVFLHLFIHLKM